MSSWKIEPNTGDYVMVGGAPEESTSLTIPAYYRLRIKRGTWLYAPNPKYGSTFHIQKKRRSTENPSLFEAIGADALQPLIDDGRASEIQIQSVVATRNAIGLETKILDAQGNIENLVLDPVGR